MDEWTMVVTDPKGNEYQNIQQLHNDQVMTALLRDNQDITIADVVKGALLGGFRDIWRQIEHEHEWGDE